MELFGDAFIPPNALPSFAGPRCPTCNSGALRPVCTDEVGGRLLCMGCGRCWTTHHGRLRGVDPISCAGCAERARSDCLALLGARFPMFGVSSVPPPTPMR